MIIAYMSIAQGGLSLMDPHTRSIPDFTITMASAIRAATAGFYMGRDECPVTIPQPLAQNFFLSYNHSSPILRNFQQFLPDIAMAAAPPSAVNPVTHFLQFSSPKSARDRIQQIASTRRRLVLEATASPTLQSNLSEILIASSSYPIIAMSRSTKSHRRPNDITLISLKQKLFLDSRGCIGEPPLYPLEKVSFRFTPTTDTKQFEVPSDLDCGLG
jgi:hypothetical protein